MINFHLSEDSVEPNVSACCCCIGLILLLFESLKNLLTSFCLSNVVLELDRLDFSGHKID